MGAFQNWVYLQHPLSNHSGNGVHNHWNCGVLHFQTTHRFISVQTHYNPSGSVCFEEPGLNWLGKSHTISISHESQWKRLCYSYFNYFQFTIAPYFTYIYIYDYMYPYYIHMTIVYIRVGCIPLSKWVMTFNPRIINIYIYIYLYWYYC